MHPRIGFCRRQINNLGRSAEGANKDQTKKKKSAKRSHKDQGFRETMLSAVKVQKDLELVKRRIPASGKTEGFKPGSGAGYTYTPHGVYDGNGNLKSDPYKGISSITYNHLNLPKLITFSSGNTIEIIYDASGNKLRKIVKQGATVQYEQDYAAGIEYRKTPAAGTFRIEAIYHEEGRYFNLNVDGSNTPSWRKEYALRDHLGSTRLLFADKDGDGMVGMTNIAATNEVLQVGAQRRSRQRSSSGSCITIHSASSCLRCASSCLRCASSFCLVASAIRFSYSLSSDRMSSS